MNTDAATRRYAKADFSVKKQKGTDALNRGHNMTSKIIRELTLICANDEKKAKN